MKREVALTIKKTLEDTMKITVLSLVPEDNILFGVYVNNVRDSLSFLSLPKSHFETMIDGINIQFFELGTVLHNIYFNGALKFIEIMCTDYDILEASNHYATLCDFVLEHIPYNIAKLRFLDALDADLSYEHKENVLMLTEVMKNFRMMLIWKDRMDDWTYVKTIDNENDFILAYNQLNKFKQDLQQENFPKISEKDMHRIDEMYINIQILHMEV